MVDGGEAIWNRQRTAEPATVPECVAADLGEAAGQAQTDEVFVPDIAGGAGLKTDHGDRFISTRTVKGIGDMQVPKDIVDRVEFIAVGVAIVYKGHIARGHA